MAYTEVAITLDDPVPEPLVADVLDKLAYVEHVRSCALDDDRARLTIRVDDDARRVEATGAVKAAIAAMVRDYRPVETTILWRHACTPRHAAPIWDALIARGLVHPEGPGCVSLLGDATRAALAVDGVFAAMARDVFGAEPHQYPTLIATSTLERCDYFSSFPHHITFAPHVDEDVAAITRIGDATAERQAAIVAGLAPPTHALSPSVCFHTYAALADRVVATNRTVTAVGRCYRWESTNFATCERLWDFTMREIVFVGDPDWVEDRRELAIGQIRLMVDELELDAWVESANDPFFVGRFAAKRYFQLLRRAKFELRLGVPYAGSSLAAASFNVHDDFFGRAFAIRGADSGYVATGCLGAGIERWVWALFAQHGPDVDRWPAGTRARLAL